MREGKILKRIHDHASRLMDTDNMYIALYDETMDTVRFGLAFVDGEPIDVATAEGWQPRQAGKGKTEEIIRTKQPLFHATKAEAEEWYHQPGHEEYVGAALPSWLGVPMMVGEKVLGVIATYHPTQDHVYSGDDLAILQAMADQAAVAIENTRLYDDRGQKVKELEKANRELEIARKQAVRATLGAMAGGYVHRLNGALGFIPASIDLVLGKVSTDVQDVLRDVKGGVAEALAFSKRMTDLFTGQELPRESVDVNLILQTIVHKRRMPSTVGVIWELESDLPEIMADKMFLTEVFSNIIVNALEAMEGKPKGELRIGSRLAADTEEVAVWISDTGCGILERNMSKIFDPEFTTKPGRHGIGLWFCDTVIKVHGGRILVDSTPEVGATFTINLPVGG